MYAPPDHLDWVISGSSQQWSLGRAQISSRPPAKMLYITFPHVGDLVAFLDSCYAQWTRPNLLHRPGRMYLISFQSSAPI